MINEDICFQLQKVNRTVTRFYDRHLSKIGITVSQFYILVKISLSKGVNCTQISKELCLDRTTLTRNLKPLLRDNLVKLVELDDRRVKSYVLTESGHKTIERCKEVLENAYHKIMENTGKRLYERLFKNLNQFICKIDGTIKVKKNY